MCNLTNPKHLNGKRTIAIEFLFAQKAICTQHITYTCRSWNALIDIHKLIHEYTRASCIGITQNFICYSATLCDANMCKAKKRSGCHFIDLM